ncbi:MAG: LPS export ABC transporter permease LptG [Methylococcales bacterium]
MILLNRYIAKEVIKSSLIALIVLLTLVNFFTLTDELGDLGQGNYGLFEIFQYVALVSPRVGYDLMPAAALLGSVFSLGAMASNRELIAMRSAGVSLLQIILGVLRAGLVLLVITVTIGELLAPVSERYAQVLRATSQTEKVASFTQYGFWIRDGNKFINIRQFNKSDELGDINIFELDGEQHLLSAIHADRAIYDGREWSLESIDQTTFEDNKFVAKSVTQATWESMLDPGLLSIVVVKPENLSIVELNRYVQFLRANGQNPRVFEAAMWRRIFNPVAILVMMMVAVPFVMTGNRTVAVGQRIVIGVIVGLAFLLFDRIFGHMGIVYNLNPLFAAVFPVSLFLIVAIIGIQRVR